jgi:hypothetical protein
MKIAEQLGVDVSLVQLGNLTAGELDGNRRLAALVVQPRRLASGITFTITIITPAGTDMPAPAPAPAPSSSYGSFGGSGAAATPAPLAAAFSFADLVQGSSEPAVPKHHRHRDCADDRNRDHRIDLPGWQILPAGHEH